jgi:hypothetical protein
VADDLTTDMRALLDVRAVFRAGQRVRGWQIPASTRPAGCAAWHTLIIRRPGSGQLERFRFSDPSLVGSGSLAGQTNW